MDDGRPLGSRSKSKTCARTRVSTRPESCNCHVSPGRGHSTSRRNTPRVAHPRADRQQPDADEAQRCADLDDRGAVETRGLEDPVDEQLCQAHGGTRAHSATDPTLRSPPAPRRRPSRDAAAATTMGITRRSARRLPGVLLLGLATWPSFTESVEPSGFQLRLDLDMRVRALLADLGRVPVERHHEQQRQRGDHRPARSPRPRRVKVIPRRRPVRCALRCRQRRDLDARVAPAGKTGPRCSATRRPARRASRRCPDRARLPRVRAVGERQQRMTTRTRGARRRPDGEGPGLRNRGRALGGAATASAMPISPASARITRCTEKHSHALAAHGAPATEYQSTTSHEQHEARKSRRSTRRF